MTLFLTLNNPPRSPGLINLPSPKCLQLFLRHNRTIVLQASRPSTRPSTRGSEARSSRPTSPDNQQPLPNPVNQQLPSRGFGATQLVGLMNRPTKVAALGGIRCGEPWSLLAASLLSPKSSRMRQNPSRQPSLPPQPPPLLPRRVADRGGMKVHSPSPTLELPLDSRADPVSGSGVVRRLMGALYRELE